MYRAIILVVSLCWAFMVNAKDEDKMFTSREMTIEIASKAAWHALLDCRKKGYSVAVAVVDRGGNLLSFYRDRFAGPHTPETAL